MIDLLGSLVIPLAALFATFAGMTVNAALHGGLVVDTITRHEALVEVAKRTRPDAGGPS